jgi:hypothetical protein
VKRWAKWLALYLLLLTAVVAMGATLDHRKARRVEAMWAAELGGRDFPTTYPTRGWNETAKRLEELSVPLGLSYSTTEHPAPAALTAELEALAKSRDERIRPEFDRWKALDRGPLTPLSAEVEADLDEALPALRAVQRLLLSSVPPDWGRDVDDPDGKRLPNLLGPLRLQRLLLLQAGRLVSSGDERGAADWLEASWRLQEARHDDPDLVVQSLVLAEQRLLQPVLRRSCAARVRFGSVSADSTCVGA